MSSNDDLAANKALVKRFCQAFYNDKDFDAAKSMLTDDFVNHHPGVKVGAEQTVNGFRDQVAVKFPQFNLEITQLVAEGDQVWAYGLIRLTTDAPVAVSVDIWRVAGDRLAEHWDVGQQITAEMSKDNLMR